MIWQHYPPRRLQSTVKPLVPTVNKGKVEKVHRYQLESSQYQKNAGSDIGVKKKKFNPIVTDLSWTSTHSSHGVVLWDNGVFKKFEQDTLQDYLKGINWRQIKCAQISHQTQWINQDRVKYAPKSAFCSLCYGWPKQFFQTHKTVYGNVLKSSPSLSLSHLTPTSTACTAGHIYQSIDSHINLLIV